MFVHVLYICLVLSLHVDRSHFASEGFHASHTLSVHWNYTVWRRCAPFVYAGWSIVKRWETNAARPHNSINNDKQKTIRLASACVSVCVYVCPIRAYEPHTHTHLLEIRGVRASRRTLSSSSEGKVVCAMMACNKRETHAHVKPL